VPLAHEMKTVPWHDGEQAGAGVGVGAGAGAAVQVVLPGLQPLGQSWLLKVPLLHLWRSPLTHRGPFVSAPCWQPLAPQLSLVHWLPSSQLTGAPKRPLLQGVN
jgi:hypothetical protein